jgi:hypothetical protein
MMRGAELDPFDVDAGATPDPVRWRQSHRWRAATPTTTCTIAPTTTGGTQKSGPSSQDAATRTRRQTKESGHSRAHLSGSFSLPAAGPSPSSSSLSSRCRVAAELPAATTRMGPRWAAAGKNLIRHLARRHFRCDAPIQTDGQRSPIYSSASQPAGHKEERARERRRNNRAPLCAPVFVCTRHVRHAVPSCARALRSLRPFVCESPSPPLPPPPAPAAPLVWRAHSSSAQPMPGQHRGRQPDASQTTRPS